MILPCHLDLLYSDNVHSLSMENVIIRQEKQYFEENSTMKCAKNQEN